MRDSFGATISITHTLPLGSIVDINTICFHVARVLLITHGSALSLLMGCAFPPMACARTTSLLPASISSVHGAHWDPVFARDILFSQT